MEIASKWPKIRLLFSLDPTPPPPFSSSPMKTMRLDPKKWQKAPYWDKGWQDSTTSPSSRPSSRKQAPTCNFAVQKSWWSSTSPAIVWTGNSFCPVCFEPELAASVCARSLATASQLSLCSWSAIHGGSGMHR